MKITLENPSRMILKNYNLSGFLFGILFCLVGIAIGFLFPAASWKARIVIFNVNVLPALSGSIFALVGIAMLANTNIVSVTLDKSIGKGAFSLRGIIKREAKDIEFANIKELVLEKFIRTSYSRKGGTSTYNQYTLNLL